MSFASSQEDGVSAQIEALRRALRASPSPPPAPPPPTVAAPPEVPAALAPYLEHTLLKPDATPDAVLRLTEEAKVHGFAGVCVNPWHVSQVAQALAGSPVVPVAVVGFPLGATFGQVKATEARLAAEAGARELDVVINVGALKAGRWDEALGDLRAVIDAARGLPVKVILETHLLTPSELVAGCVVSELAGAAFVKTSTGFTGGGATVEDILRMRAAVGDRLAVKASGGVRTWEGARALLAAGARRLGSSASVELVRGSGRAGAY